MGVKPSTNIQSRHSGSGDSAGGALLRLPSSNDFDKAHRPFIDNLVPRTLTTLWSADEASGISTEFDYGVFCNYGGTYIHVFVYVDGGVSGQEMVAGFRTRPGGDYNISGIWYNADEGVGEVGTPSPIPTIVGRVTKVAVYSEHVSEIGGCEFFMYAEEEA